MSKAAAAIAQARKWVGIKEGVQADKKILSIWNKKTGCHAKSKVNPWCAIFIAALLIKIGASCFSLSATCKNQRAYFKKKKRWLARLKRPGNAYIIFITGHEGIVIKTYANGKGSYISGNSLNAVRISSFNWKTGKTASGKKILGYGIPKY